MDTKIRWNVFFLLVVFLISWCKSNVVLDVGALTLLEKTSVIFLPFLLSWFGKRFSFLLLLVCYCCWRFQCYPLRINSFRWGCLLRNIILILFIYYIISACSTAQLMLSLEFSVPNHLIIGIHMFVPSTEPFLSDIREPRNRFLQCLIWCQLLASSKLSSIIPIINRLTVQSQQQDTCWVNKLGSA